MDVFLAGVEVWKEACSPGVGVDDGRQVRAGEWVSGKDWWLGVTTSLSLSSKVPGNGGLFFLIGVRLSSTCRTLSIPDFKEEFRLSQSPPSL